MAYEIISVYRSPKDRDYDSIFARKLKDRHHERCVYISDLEIKFPRIVGLMVEVQVDENMIWVPLGSVKEQDRDVVILNADQLGSRFLAIQKEIAATTTDTHTKMDNLQKRLTTMMSEFKSNYGNSFNFTGEQVNMDLNKLVMVLQDGSKQVSDIKGISSTMITDLHYLLTLEKLLTRVKAGTFQLCDWTTPEQERLARMDIELKDFVDKSSAVNQRTGNEILNIKLPIMEIAPPKQSETQVTGPILPKHVYNWGVYDREYNAFYEREDIKAILAKSYDEIAEKSTLSGKIETHSNLVSFVSYWLQQVFTNRLLKQVRFINEPTNKVAHADIYADLISKTLAVFEIKLGFNGLNSELLKNEKPTKNSRQNSMVEMYKRLASDHKTITYSGILANLIQIHTYMSVSKLRYGILTNIEFTWIMMLDDHGFHVSHCLQKEEFLPNVFFILGSAIEKSETQGKKQTIPKEIGATFEVNYVFNQLRHADFIGEGRAGPVFKIRYKNQDVAAKLIDTSKCDKTILDESKNEVNIYQRLAKVKIRCVPRLIFNQNISFIYVIATTYIVGKHIDFDRMNKEQKRQCMRSLKELHRAGVLHGDIKPENFIVCPGRIFIIDFGFSSITDDLEKLKAEEEELEYRLRDSDECQEDEDSFFK